MTKKLKEPQEESASALIEKRRMSLIKVLPSTVTLTAFCFGLTSIRFALFDRWEYAVMCIFASALLDAFDGKVARLLGQSSQFGAQLDSLSDLVCFGVAPAMILFLKSMHSMEKVGWGVCMFFTVCCAIRLARFNTMQIIEEGEKPAWMKKYFTGVPAPAGAILALFPMILYFETGKECFLHPIFDAIFLVASGILMISTLKTFSSKMIEIKNGIFSLELLGISLIVILLITELWLTLSIMILAYIISLPYGAKAYAKAEKEYSENKE